MDEKRLRDFLRAHVGFMETSDRDPNKANFAGIDTSGLTYGRMQNDTGSNDMARAALGAMLMMEGMTQEEWARLDPVLATKRLTKVDLESRYPGASGKINDALAANSEFVTNMDDNSLAHVVDEVKRVFGAAKGRGGFNPDNPNWTMVGEAGAWANQVPDLKDTAKAIGEMPEITNDAFDAYMRQRDYFSKNDPNPPKRWGDWRGRIDEGTRRGLAAIAPQDEGYLSQQPHFEKRPKDYSADFAGRVDDATRDALVDTLPELQSPVPNLFNNQTYRDSVYDSAGRALRGALGQPSGGQGFVARAPAHEGEPWDEKPHGPAPGNLFNVDALPENLLNMPDYELRKWGLR